MVLIFILCKMILAFKSVDEECDIQMKATAQYFRVKEFVTPCKVIQILASVVVIQLVHEDALFMLC